MCLRTGHKNYHPFPPERMYMASLVNPMVKNMPAMQESWVPSLGWKGLLEKGMATHPSILAWRIPGAEEPGGLESIRLQSCRVRYSWMTNVYTHAYCSVSCASTTHPALLPLTADSALCAIIESQSLKLHWNSCPLTYPRISFLWFRFLLHLPRFKKCLVTPHVLSCFSHHFCWSRRQSSSVVLPTLSGPTSSAPEPLPPTAGSVPLCPLRHIKSLHLGRKSAPGPQLTQTLPWRRLLGF